MKKIVIAAAVLLALSGAAAVFAEEAELLPESTLRLTIAPSFGFQVQEWEGSGDDTVMLFNTGLGLEYGVNNWLSAQVLWIPGVNAWSKLDGGKYGLFSDVFLGIKTGIIGSGAPVDNSAMRLSLAGGITAPLPSSKGSTREGDYHLWGSVLRLYYDYIFSPLFYLNAFAEMVYFPSQRLIGPNYGTRSVNHPLDCTFELDSRFRYPLEDKGLVLHWGIPLTFRLAPWLNRNDEEYGMESAYNFSVGAFFTVTFAELKFPLDLTLRYSAPVAGQYEQPVHRVSLLGRLNFKL
ncbi:MAG: hypothetical protein LBD48_14110 [Treponema sp.]|jgi:hypothetical protein|nr:hypothetical protein [Treponema sp.]